MSKFCMNCGAELPQEAGFCPKCGTKVEVPICPACGKEVDLDADFCLYCGTRLHEPEPESEPRKQEDIPEYCQRCGKKSVPGYDHCVYCGTAWDTEVPEKLKAEPQKPKAAAEPTAWDIVRPETAAPRPASGPTSAINSRDASDRTFSWSYKRASMISRFARHHVEMVVELDDQRLRCTDSRKGWGASVTETELQLKDISKIAMGAKASFLCWVLVTLLGSAAVAFLLLPALGVSVAASAGELMGAGLVLVFCCAIEAWWARFNLYHYRLVIAGNGADGPTEIVLEATKADTLREIQGELTRRTSIPAQPLESSTAAIKAVIGALIGIGIVVAIALFAIKQNPQPGQATANKVGGSSTTGSAITTKSAMERELYGTWEATGGEISGETYYLDDGDALYLDLHRDGTCTIATTMSGEVSYGDATWTLPGLNELRVKDDGGVLDLTVAPDGSRLYMAGESEGVSYTYIYTKTQSGKLESILSQISSDDSPSIYADELLGTWQDTVYDASYTVLTLEKQSDGRVSVNLLYGRSNEYVGTLEMDGEGNLYSDMTSLYFDSPGPHMRFHISYDGYGITAYDEDTENDYPYYFTRI